MKYLLSLLVILNFGCVNNDHHHHDWENTIVQPTPNPVSSVPNSSYLGCYTDTPTRVLGAELMSSGATVEGCIAAATASGYSFAAVEYGVQCFAGDTMPTLPIAVSNCDMPCAANSVEMCGGTWAMDVYYIN
jgi:glucan endo-1,3-alpha-glucosidase